MPRMNPPGRREIVRSGLITGEASVDAHGVIIHGPLAFDDETVAATGAWFHDIDPGNDLAIERALYLTYRRVVGEQAQ